MAHSLNFSQHYVYRPAVGIGVPVRITAGAYTAKMTANIDTGASRCLFQRDVADQLGLTLEGGYRTTFSTATGSFEAYGHEVIIDVLGIQFETTVFFFADPEIKKNVLGRRGWLDRVHLGLVDYDQTLYLADYNVA